MDDMAPAEMRATLRPRNPGESLKVAETVLKRRDRNLKAAAQRAAQIQRIKSNKKEYKKGKLKIVRAEKLIKQSMTKEKDRKRQKNMTKKPLQNVQRDTKGRVLRTLVAVRNGRPGGTKEVKEVLATFGLDQKHTSVFLQNTEEVLEKLRVVRPFVFWGAPSFKVAFDLVHKKAMFRDPGNPTAKTMLSDNTLIEKHLGDLGALCTEDLAHAIHTRSKVFDQVNAKLWPMPLGDSKKANGLIADQRFTMGNLKEGINGRIQKLLGE